MELAGATTQLADPVTQRAGRALVAPCGSEQDLVAAVRDGDDRAFGALYSRYERRIRAYIFGLVADHGRAEDIAQEVFISALRRLRDTERPVAFKPWIYEIARNACIDEYRRTCRSPRGSARRWRRWVGTRPRAVVGALPDDAIESKQRLDDLRDAFRGLSDNHHQDHRHARVRGSLVRRDRRAHGDVAADGARAPCSGPAGGSARSTSSWSPASVVSRSELPSTAARAAR